MNELKIWNNFKELQKYGKFESNYYLGYVYFVEYGKHVKIGCTKNPIKRLGSLYSNAKSYHDIELGRIYITPKHTNYRENESILHSYFINKRKENSELFSITIEDAIDSISKIPSVSYTHLRAHET